MASDKNEIFLETFEEYVFLFQMDTGLLLELKPTSHKQKNLPLSEVFYFDLLSMSLKVLGQYRANPQTSTLTLEKDLGVTAKQRQLVENSFENFFKNAKLKTLFA